MIIPKGLDTGFDTRGLPFGYDPHNFYEYRFEKLRNNTTGLEWFLHQYIPYSLLKSFAIAIDPLTKFKVSPGVITEGNRHKYRATASVLQMRSKISVQHNRSFQVVVNYKGLGGCNSRFLVEVPPAHGETVTTLSSQPPLPDQLTDTTSRTRLMGSSQGTLKLFKGFARSPSRKVERYDDVIGTFNLNPDPPGDPCIVNGGTYTNRSYGRELRTTRTIGAGSILSAQNHTLLMNSEYAYCEGLIQSNILAMLKGWSPNKRDYTLFRNLVELRDVPRSIASLRQTVSDFRSLYVSLSSSKSLRKIIFDLKSTSSDIPNEYLSYHFGWRQLYRDVSDLLAYPARFSKKINFLVQRNGKPTTYRSKRSFVSGDSGVSGFEYDALEGELAGTQVTSSRVIRESELRLVINATFDFPDVSAPSFRRNEFIRRMGIEPRPTDLYNLVPWTWLVDWFSGLGNYVEMIDIINSDPTLINWGLITCVSKGSLITDFTSKSRNTVHRYWNGWFPLEESFLENRHTSNFDFVCEMRKDVSTALDVKQTSDPASLSDFQKSIIGSLLLQRINFSRSQSFRPRS